MLTRILALASLLLVLAVPAALAADGAPPQSPRGNPAAAGAHGGGGRLQQRLADLRVRLQHAGGAFAKRCVSGKADTAKCTAAAKKLLAALQRIDGRIDTLIGRIQQRCSQGATPTAQPGQAAPPCSRVQQVVQLLQNVQAKLRQFEQKLQDWLANPTAASPDGTAANGSSSTTTSDSSLEGLDQLAADLAAARDAATQSGL